MENLTSFQRDLVAFIGARGPCSGTELKEALEQRKEKAIHHSRLYDNLGNLEEMGYIAVKKDTGDRSNENRLLPLGRRELTQQYEWLTTQVEQMNRKEQQQPPHSE
jgi:DNA-binding PadR family transcriptional regulator